MAKKPAPRKSAAKRPGPRTGSTGRSPGTSPRRVPPSPPGRGPQDVTDSPGRPSAEELPEDVATSASGIAESEAATESAPEAQVAEAQAAEAQAAEPSAKPASAKAAPGKALPRKAAAAEVAPGKSVPEEGSRASSARSPSGAAKAAPPSKTPGTATPATQRPATQPPTRHATQPATPAPAAEPAGEPAPKLAPEPASEPASEPATAPATAGAADAPTPARAGTTSSRRPHVRAAALIGVLTAALGFAIAVQVRANSRSDSLSTLREQDLIGILDNQNSRADRLRRQISDLQQTLTRLRDSGDQSAAAQQQAKQDAQALGILLGTLPATGPGVEVTITDPQRKLRAEDLLDVVEELRGAGAEAIDFAGVRVSTDTAFRDVGGGVTVDGTAIEPPYRVTAIGGATTLDTALNIPGGVASTVRAAGGDLVVVERPSVTITSTRGLRQTHYVKPAAR